MISNSLPLVSIIVPVYNLEKYIGDCLQSILNQTYANWEAIVIDDGSSDNSPEIIKSFAEKDERFRIITTENGGSAHARNLGLDVVRGKFVMFVDGDDMITPNAVETSVRLIRDKEVDILATSSVSISEDGKTELMKSPQPAADRLSAAETLPLIHSGKMISGIWTKLYNANLLKYQRFNLRLRMAQDTYFNTELLLDNPEISVGFADIAIYRYRIRKNSVCHLNPDTKMRPYLEEMELLIEKYSSVMDPALFKMLNDAQFSRTINLLANNRAGGHLPEDWQLRILRDSAKALSGERFCRIMATLESGNRCKIRRMFFTMDIRKKYNRIVNAIQRRICFRR